MAQVESENRAIKLHGSNSASRFALAVSVVVLVRAPAVTTNVTHTLKRARRAKVEMFACSGAADRGDALRLGTAIQRECFGSLMHYNMNQCS